MRTKTWLYCLIMSAAFTAAAQVNQTIIFPDADDTRFAPGPTFWRAGDYIEGSRTFDCPTDQFLLKLVIRPNVLGCDTQDEVLLLDGVAVDQFSIHAGETEIVRAVNCPGLSAGAHTIRIQTLRTVAVGCGSAGFPDGESTIEVPCAPTAPPTIPVQVDIKPGGCPNPIEVNTRGTFPVAVLGSANFSVSSLDPASLTLSGVTALKFSIEDVATPFAGEKVDCQSCTVQGADGFPDLVLHFDTQAVLDAIKASLAESGAGLTDGACLLLKLEGRTQDGIQISGEDTIRILNKVNLNSGKKNP
jgi:hypothetical protein